MQAEVMAIGDELTSGQRLDTNSQWLSQQLGDLGIRVTYHTAVGDDSERLIEAWRTAAARSDLIVSTGGLGPTADDLTRQSLAEAEGRPLQLNPQVFEGLRRRFAERGRTMAPQNRIQACFPVGSQVIDNPEGTAPGIDLEMRAPSGHRCRCFALPGVPAEMRQMWRRSVRPTVELLRGPGRVICHHRLKCFGVGESELEAMLPDLIRRGRQPQVGITVHRATITLRVTAAGPDREHCWQAMRPTLETIRETLGVLVFGEEDDELQHAVVRQLAHVQQTLAICEWGTLGLVTHWLHRVDDSAHARLQGSIVIHSPHSLRTLLGLSVEQTRGDAAERAGEMARAIRARCGTDYGLAVGEPPDSQQPLPQIHLALDTPQGLQVCVRSYAGHSDILLERAAKHALDLVRLKLLQAKEV